MSRRVPLSRARLLGVGVFVTARHHRRFAIALRTVHDRSHPCRPGLFYSVSAARAVPRLESNRHSSSAYRAPVPDAIPNALPPPVCAQVSQVLPLQVLWDPKHGVLGFLPDDFHSQVMCKAYTVISLGVCQPFLLFLTAALCRFAVRYAPHWRKQPPIRAVANAPLGSPQAAELSAQTG